MASQEDDHITTVYGEDLDEDDDTEDEDLTLRNQNVEEDDVDLVDDEEEDDSMSSGVGEVTIAVPGVPTAADTDTVAATPTAAITSTVDVTPVPRSDVVLEQKKIMPLDESRRLFQRLWTDEDEIELLQGFFDYTNQLVVNNSFHHHHHHDTTAFYDQIKNKLQLDFNKNQLVEKLRRLKKKYRNVLSKISSGKDYVFKTPHDQITFDISCKIWSSEAAVLSTPASVASADVGRFEDEEPSNPYPNLNLTFNLNEQNGNGSAYPNSSEKKIPRSRKRSRSSGVKIEEKTSHQQPAPAVGVGASNSSNPTPNLVEETVKSCLLPLFKELLDSSQNGLRGSSRGLMNLDPFGGSMNLPFGDITDEKWRKQHILELEVCSKRLELVQDQIKSQLEELRSMRR
ncbi:probable transcription factor At5g28040 [Cynara cardunculus var. scolymus]|uniref:probable transcription factor At5g28040 n=1 Tax=Cynara cardunculus var. scolymus TaxID=59895 RepID=UPI000D6260E5|nr:probable transcription factor At5g28040 [Cynara cardunculus var. scolymus]